MTPEQDAFPRITTDMIDNELEGSAGLFAPLQMPTPEEVMERIGRLYEARLCLQAIHELTAIGINNNAAVNEHAEVAIEIIDSLRWLWDEVVPNPEWLAERIAETGGRC